MIYDVAIIGAGASGLVSAILSARNGLKVALIEAQKRGGKKILASGNGHCNIANSSVSKKNFYGKNSTLIAEIAKQDLAQIEHFFNSLGLEFIAKEDGKIYPKSMQANSVLELLEAEIKRLNIATFYEAEQLKVNKGFELNFKTPNRQQKISAKKLIIATGSKAAPQLGGNSSGLEIAKSFGHTIIEPTPALVPVVSSNPICKKLAGVKVKAKVRLFINNQESSYTVGDFLFAKYGVSGLTILDLSLKISLALKEKKNCFVLVDFFSEYSKHELIAYLKSRINKERNLPLNLWLGAILNSKLSKEILKELNLYELTEAKLNNKNIKAIVELFKNYKIELEDTREFKYAEVAYGGVNSQELDGKTLQSKKVKNLYFVGEIIDIIGDRGGYNFYFAWSGAFIVCRANKR